MGKILENPKQLILYNAKNILYTEGYSNLNIRSVAKACNLAVGTIYNYYPSKKELVIEMMVEYWKECFKVFEAIIQSNDSLYEKLFKIFNELNTFISTFKEVWLKASSFENAEYTESGMEKEHLYIEMLVRKIEALLVEESLKDNTEISIKINSYELANFILMNFITMIQMPMFKYSCFEQILKQLLI
jgi:AcrR family transcriptional regulator